MKNTISLFNPKMGLVYTIDASTLIFRFTQNNNSKEFRLKPFHCSILYTLFAAHPQPVDYKIIEEILVNHQLQCPDNTRLHRKISEIRIALSHIHPSLEQLIQNTRGIGYSLLLDLRPADSIYTNNELGLRSKLNQNVCEDLFSLVQSTISLVQDAKIIRTNDLYLIDRAPFQKILEENITLFDKIEADIINHVSTPKLEMSNFNLRYLLLKLRTYIGLARVSQKSTFLPNWQETFVREILDLYQDLQKLIKNLE